MPVVFFLLIIHYQNEKAKRGDSFYNNNVFLDHGLTKLPYQPDHR